MSEIICLKNVSKSYKSLQSKGDRTLVLKNIDLTIQAGEFISIIGKSGEGKSTLLHLIAGLDTPDTGEIIGFNINITGSTEKERILFRKEHIGLLFQHHGLLRDFTVVENIALVKNISGSTWEESRKQAEEHLYEFDLIKRKNHYPFELSGGEKQRVALIRALIGTPKLLLADEPTGNLDPYNTELVLKIIKSIWKKKQMSVVLVTHDESIQKICQKTYLISEKQIVSL